MTLKDLLGMSPAEKVLVMMAVDVYWMPFMDERPGARFSRVSISLIGRRGFLDYTEEEIDGEIEDYAEDLVKLADTTDELVAWAQETSGVQYVDVATRDWKYRTKEGVDTGPFPEGTPRGVFGELVKELDGIRDESSEEPGFIYVNGRIDVRLLGKR